MRTSSLPGLTAGLEIPVMIAAGRVAMRVGRGRLVGMSVVLATVSFCLLPVAAYGSAPVIAGAITGVTAWALGFGNVFVTG